MVASCKDLRDAVALCLQRSDCVLIERHTPKECLQDPVLNKTLPEPCYVHFLRYMDCKRGQADRSKRFIGNGPMSNGKYEKDLELLRTGNFDPAVELEKQKKGDAPVSSLAELAQIDRENKYALQQQNKNNSWINKLKGFKWW